jgi:hypothetical protein
MRGVLGVVSLWTMGVLATVLAAVKGVVHSETGCGVLGRCQSERTCRESIRRRGVTSCSRGVTK